MRKCFVVAKLAVPIFICAVPVSGYAICDRYSYDPLNGNIDQQEVAIDGCSSYTVLYYANVAKMEGVAVSDCSACRSGYVRKQESFDAGEISGTCLGTVVTRYTCECAGCSNCQSTDWTSAGDGYQSRVIKTCDCNTCNSYTEYRCATGYYGSSENGTAGCIRCPTWSGVYTSTAKTSLIRGTSLPGATAIAGCYIPVDTQFFDIKGEGVLTENCYHNKFAEEINPGGEVIGGEVIGGEDIGGEVIDDSDTGEIAMP